MLRQSVGMACGCITYCSGLTSFSKTVILDRCCSEVMINRGKILTTLNGSKFILAGGDWENHWCHVVKCYSEELELLLSAIMLSHAVSCLKLLLEQELQYWNLLFTETFLTYLPSMWECGMTFFQNFTKHRKYHCFLLQIMRCTHLG